MQLLTSLSIILAYDFTHYSAHRQPPANKRAKEVIDFKKGTGPIFSPGKEPSIHSVVAVSDDKRRGAEQKQTRPQRNL
jgi:hypothetical protein